MGAVRVVMREHLLLAFHFVCGCGCVFGGAVAKISHSCAVKYLKLNQFMRGISPRVVVDLPLVTRDLEDKGK